MSQSPITVTFTREQAEADLAEWLSSREGRSLLDAFIVGLNESDVPAFTRNIAEVRYPCQQSAPQWWQTVYPLLAPNDLNLMAFGHYLIGSNVSLAHVSRALATSPGGNRLIDAIESARNNVWVASGFPVSNTKGWTEARILESIEEAKARAGWADATEIARRWWDAFVKENQHRHSLILRFIEEIVGREATITDFYAAYLYSNSDNIQANLHYLDYSKLKKELEKRLASDPEAQVAPGATSSTKEAGAVISWESFQEFPFLDRILELSEWSRPRLNAKLEELKSKLDWERTTGSARKWWEALEGKGKTELQRVIRLADALVNRRATITEFFLAYVYSNTQDILANLHYLDYTRLKKEEERKRREAAVAKATIPAQNLNSEPETTKDSGGLPAPSVPAETNSSTPQTKPKRSSSDWRSVTDIPELGLLQIVDLPAVLKKGHKTTNTKGWTEDQLRARLEEVKSRLAWENTSGSALGWWEEFEAENQHRLALILRLAEELEGRRATITEFFLAYLYSSTDNIQANLHYLDFARLKKWESAAENTWNEWFSIDDEDAQDGEQGSVLPPRNDVPVEFGSTRTDGWPLERLMAHLNQLKVKIALEDAARDAQDWWLAQLKDERGPRRLIALSEVLDSLKATFSEFFEAGSQSGVRGVRARVVYMEYVRLKRIEESRRAESTVQNEGDN